MRECKPGSNWDLKEAFFLRGEKNTLDPIGWGPLYALYDHESMCVRKLITWRYFYIPITWSYGQLKIFYRHLKLSEWKLSVLKKWLKTWIFYSFIESMLIYVENRYIPCFCTHFSIVFDSIDSTWWWIKILMKWMTPLDDVLDIYNHSRVRT